MNKFIGIVDCLWHPSGNVRDELRKHGLYVYDMRSWDEGCGNTLEKFVVVNYEGSVVTNFEITDWDYDNVINDEELWRKNHPEVESRDFDTELEKTVQDIIKKLED